MNHRNNKTTTRRRRGGEEERIFTSVLMDLTAVSTPSQSITSSPTSSNRHRKRQRTERVLLLNVADAEPNEASSSHHPNTTCHGTSFTQSPSSQRRRPIRSTTSMTDSLFLLASPSTPQQHQPFNDSSTSMRRHRQQQQQSPRRRGASEFTTTKTALSSPTTVHQKNKTSNLPTRRSSTSFQTEASSSLLIRTTKHSNETIHNDHNNSDVVNETMKKSQHLQMDSMATTTTIATAPSSPLASIVRKAPMERNQVASLHVPPIQTPSTRLTESAEARPPPQRRRWTLVPNSKILRNQIVRSTSTTKSNQVSTTTSESIPLMQSSVRTIAATTRTLRSDNKTISPTLKGDDEDMNQDSDHSVHAKKGVHTVQQQAHLEDATSPFKATMDGAFEHTTTRSRDKRKPSYQPISMKRGNHDEDALSHVHAKKLRRWYLIESSSSLDKGSATNNNNGQHLITSPVERGGADDHCKLQDGLQTEKTGLKNRQSSTLSTDSLSLPRESSKTTDAVSTPTAERTLRSGTKMAPPTVEREKDHLNDSVDPVPGKNSVVLNQLRAHSGDVTSSLLMGARGDSPDETFVGEHEPSSSIKAGTNTAKSLQLRNNEGAASNARPQKKKPRACLVEPTSSEKGATNNKGRVSIQSPAKSGKKVDHTLHHVPRGSLFPKNRRDSRLGNDSLSLQCDGSQTTNAVLTRTMKRILRSDAKKLAASATGEDALHVTDRSVPGKTRVDRDQQLVQFGDVTSPLVMATRGAFVGEYTTKSSIMSREKPELERKEKAKSIKLIDRGSSEKGSINNGRSPTKAPAQREVDDGLDKKHDGILTESMGLKNRQGRRLRTDSLSLPVDTSQTVDAASIEMARRVLRSDTKIMSPTVKANKGYHSEQPVSAKKKVDRVRQLAKAEAVTSPLLMATGGDAEERTLVGEREIASGKKHKLETRDKAKSIKPANIDNDASIEHRNKMRRKYLIEPCSLEKYSINKEQTLFKSPVELRGDFDDDKLYDGVTEIMGSKTRQDRLVVDSQPPSLLLQNVPHRKLLATFKGDGLLKIGAGNLTETHIKEDLRKPSGRSKADGRVQDYNRSKYLTTFVTISTSSLEKCISGQHTKSIRRGSENLVVSSVDFFDHQDSDGYRRVEDPPIQHLKQKMLTADSLTSTALEGRAQRKEVQQESRLLKTSLFKVRSRDRANASRSGAQKVGGQIPHDLLDKRASVLESPEVASSKGKDRRKLAVDPDDDDTRSERDESDDKSSRMHRAGLTIDSLGKTAIPDDDQTRKRYESSVSSKLRDRASMQERHNVITMPWGDPMTQDFAEPEEEDIGRLLYRSRCHSSDDLSWDENAHDDAEESEDQSFFHEQPFWHLERRRRRKKYAVPKPLILPEYFYREGDYILKFQNDYLGRQPVDPATLRYGLRLAQSAARQATQSIAHSLLNNGEMGEGRRVQVKAVRHVNKILENVEERMLQEKIPERYIKMEDMYFGKSLPHVNQKRRKEVEANQKLIQQMQERLAASEEDHAQLASKRDQFEQSVVNADLDSSSLHQVLKDYKLRPSQPSPAVLPLDSRVELLKTGTGFLEAPKGTLFKFTRAAWSPYEE